MKMTEQFTTSMNRKVCYEDGYKNGKMDFKYKIANSIEKYLDNGTPVWNCNKLFDILNDEFKKNWEKR